MDSHVTVKPSLHSPRVSVEILVPAKYAKLFTLKQLTRMLVLSCKHRARQAANPVSKRTSRDRNGSKIMGQGPTAVGPQVSKGHKQQFDGGASLAPVKSKRAVRREKRRAAAKKARAKTETTLVKRGGPSVHAPQRREQAIYSSSLLSNAAGAKTRLGALSRPPQTNNAPRANEGGFTLTSISPVECREEAARRFHPITGTFRGAPGFCARSREGCGSCTACVDRQIQLGFNRSFDAIGTSRVIRVDSMKGEAADDMASPSASEPVGFWAPAEKQAPTREGRPIKRCDVVTLARVVPVLRMLRKVDPTFVDNRLLWEAAHRTVFPQRKCAYPAGCFGDYW
uniref:Polyprotein n=1 Tax=Grapevine fanleaf virus satellite RNA TaxID=141860 RepID=A0A2K8GK21_9VIRU|nr:polyprotein [Grapevine fanleaf virus satellite RNA]